MLIQMYFVYCFYANYIWYYWTLKCTVTSWTPCVCVCVIISVEVFLTSGTLELQPIHQVWNW